MLDDESLTFGNAQELEMLLDCEVEVDATTAQALAADGGAFDVAGDIKGSGVGAAEVSRLAELHNEAAGAPASKKARTSAGAVASGSSAGGKGAAGQQGGQDVAGQQQGGQGAQPAVKETSLQKAKAALKELSKCVSATHTVVLDCKRANASQQLEAELSAACGGMNEQFSSLDSWIKLGSSDEGFYDGMVDHTKQMIRYAVDKADYAKALINVCKRKEKAMADANAAVAAAHVGPVAGA